MPRLHRNNAAEKIMVIALWPIAWVMRRMQKNREEIAKMKKTPRSRVVIEGLPPRTMN